MCLLDSLGKMAEHIIKHRLEQELEDKNGLSRRQFGFRRRRSTIDALNWAEEYVKDRQTHHGIPVDQADILRIYQPERTVRPDDDVTTYTRLPHTPVTTALPL
ncbi:hypothetical protein JTB14_024487 [Gonioctena quinquepunctata]|nr:hypothetical protein JTB14_024487 [Gonioctena quinquepunctata]